VRTGTKLGRYEIRAKIGEGGMGEVYLAQDMKLDRKVALKILPAEVAADRNRMSPREGWVKSIWRRTRSWTVKYAEDHQRTRRAVSAALRLTVLYGGSLCGTERQRENHRVSRKGL
jgi:serine/threonine protein kinase